MGRFSKNCDFNRADRLGRRTRNRMTLGRAGQRAAGEHTDADDADTGRHSMINQRGLRRRGWYSASLTAAGRNASLKQYPHSGNLISAA